MAGSPTVSSSPRPRAHVGCRVCLNITFLTLCARTCPALTLQAWLSCARVGPSLVVWLPARGVGTAAGGKSEAAPACLVKLDEGNYMVFEEADVMAMTATKILKVLLPNESFEALSKRELSVRTSASKKRPSDAEEKLSVKLEGSEALGDLVAGLPPGNIFIHVRPPPPPQGSLTVIGASLTCAALTSHVLHAHRATRLYALPSQVRRARPLTTLLLCHAAVALSPPALQARPILRASRRWHQRSPSS